MILSIMLKSMMVDAKEIFMPNQKARVKTVLLSIAWAILILIFPVVSGIIAVVCELNQVEIYLLQGSFMLLSLIVPAIYIYKKKIAREIGIRGIETGSAKSALYFLPLVLCQLPLLVVGVSVESVSYAFALLFFAVAVGISEEIYFRGIILRLLKNQFSIKLTVVISTLIFGIGHIVGALSGAHALDIFLQIVNAIVFGIIASQIVIITKSLLPTVLWHIVFNFSNHITTAAGNTEIIVIAVQEVIMLAFAVFLWLKLPKSQM